MKNTDTRVEDLLNSLVGCDFLIKLVESGLSLEVLADPKVSLWLEAVSIESVSIHDPIHNLLAAELPAHAGREQAVQARAVIEHPATAWWFDDIDLNPQAWVSIHWTAPPLEFIYGTSPNTMGWQRPRNPSRRWERYAQKPLSSHISHQSCMDPS
jgi:hypothetical protein